MDGFLEAAVRVTPIHGRVSPLFGVAALLGFPGGWRAGGAGFFVFDGVALEVPPGFPDAELRVGYGGVLVERSTRLRAASGDSAAPPSWSARLLVGAGNVDVESAATRTRLDSDNFMVVEPTLALELPLHARARVGIVLGYRLVTGVEGLEDFGRRGLGGVTAGAVLRAGPF